MNLILFWKYAVIIVDYKNILNYETNLAIVDNLTRLSQNINYHYIYSYTRSEIEL